LAADAPGLDTLVLWQDGRVYTASTAVLWIAAALRFPWMLLGVFLLTPPALQDAVPLGGGPPLPLVWQTGYLPRGLARRAGAFSGCVAALAGIFCGKHLPVSSPSSIMCGAIQTGGRVAQLVRAHGSHP